ncbi:MAG: hypothetical protein L3K09_00050 [Thermoplasmata archaeon]|nr:hypothetical protein [Thermoplasmata archaeon]
MSFSSALAAAESQVSSQLGGSWTAVNAMGLVTAASLSLPAPNNTYGALSGSNCTWSSPSHSPFTNVLVPASPASLGAGLSPFWAISFSDPAGDTLIVTVIGGIATAYAELSAACSTGSYPSSFVKVTTTFGGLDAVKVDSPTAVNIANSWGGSAFLANASVQVRELMVSGSVTTSVSYNSSYPWHYNGSGCNGTNSTVVSPCAPPVPFPLNNTSYTSPSAWDVIYTSCSPFSPGACSSNAMFSASLNAVNGTLSSAQAWLTGGYGNCYGGPALLVPTYYGCMGGPPLGAPYSTGAGSTVVP